ncbi:MAG: hypothetical protein JSV73_04570, partial [Flavobacteriaceae bacterium]
MRAIKYRQSLQIRTLEHIVQSYGIREGWLTGDDSRLVEDAFYFGLSKGCRALRAFRLLYDLGYHDEGLIVLRAVYEAYLFAACASTSDVETVAQHLVKHPIGITLGIFEKRKSSGKKAIVDTRSGKLMKTRNTQPASFVKATGHKLDVKIHPFLYSFLCDYAHTNMSTSGSYSAISAPYEFSCKPRNSEYRTAVILALYFGNLLISQAVLFEDFDPPGYDSAGRQLIGAAIQIHKYLCCTSTASDLQLRQHMWDRTKEAL